MEAMNIPLDLVAALTPLALLGVLNLVAKLRQRMTPTDAAPARACLGQR
jgi:hypothetical protein